MISHYNTIGDLISVCWRDYEGIKSILWAGIIIDHIYNEDEEEDLQEVVIYLIKLVLALEEENYYVIHIEEVEQ